MAVFIQLLIGGVLQGGIYALGAFGLSLIFGVLRVLNVAHGDFLVLGGFATYWLYTTFGLSPFLAIPLILPAFILIGMMVERIMIRPIRARTAHEFLVASILVTLGIALAVEDLLAFSMTQPVKGIDYSLNPIRIGDVVISTLRLVSLGAIVILTVALHMFLTRTLHGKAIRAVIEDKEGAMLAGINVQAVSRNTFGIGTALTAVAGVFFVSLIPVEPHLGIPLTLKYLSIIVLGGIGNLPGTLLGSMILGTSESLVGFWLGAEWSLTVAFLILILILLLRPTGLFGARPG
jgi:branched-chain amino acid transport system permease protein